MTPPKLMITGSFPPEVCGVGDYTSKLLKADKNNEYILFHKTNWSLKKFFEYIKEISKTKPRAIFLQYPTEGYGWSLLPQLLCVYFSLFTKIQFNVVLHELSNRTTKAKFASYPFRFSNKCIFTTEYEREYAIKHFFNKKKCFTIPIISNIPKSNNKLSFEDRKFDLVYFGHIRPNKGLEDWLETSIDLYKSGIISGSLIIGQIPKGYEDYVQSLKQYSFGANIQWIHNLSEVQVADYLSNCKIAFLPFPDGVSERRGSFLAALNNEVIPVTYSGKYLTNRLTAVSYITDKNHAKDTISKILRQMNAINFKKFLAAANSYLTDYLPTDWKDVLSKYNKL